MAAKHQFGLTGECTWAKDKTYLYHKTEVIHLLKQQITRNPNNPGDWSFSVIFFLIAMEVGEKIAPNLSIVPSLMKRCRPEHAP